MMLNKPHLYRRIMKIGHSSSAIRFAIGIGWVGTRQWGNFNIQKLQSATFTRSKVKRLTNQLLKH